MGLILILVVTGRERSRPQLRPYSFESRHDRHDPLAVARRPHTPCLTEIKNSWVPPFSTGNICDTLVLQLPVVFVTLRPQCPCLQVTAHVPRFLLARYGARFHPNPIQPWSLIGSSPRASYVDRTVILWDLGGSVCQQLAGLADYHRDARDAFLPDATARWPRGCRNLIWHSSRGDNLIDGLLWVARACSRESLDLESPRKYFSLSLDDHLLAGLGCLPLSNTKTSFRMLKPVLVPVP